MAESRRPLFAEPNRFSRPARAFSSGKAPYFANAGDDLHADGSLAPIVDGFIGCIVVAADGSRYVARVVPDPLARGEPGGRQCRQPSTAVWKS